MHLHVTTNTIQKRWCQFAPAVIRLWEYELSYKYIYGFRLLNPIIVTAIIFVIYKYIYLFYLSKETKSRLLCFRLFGTSAACSGCGQMIPASDYVMRAQGNVYHLKCFACVKCHNQLVAGDRFNLVNGSVLCEQDCIKMLKGTATTVGTVRKNSKMRMNAAIKV